MGGYEVQKRRWTEIEKVNGLRPTREPLIQHRHERQRCTSKYSWQKRERRYIVRRSAFDRACDLHGHQQVVLVAAFTHILGSLSERGLTSATLHALTQSTNVHLPQNRRGILSTMHTQHGGSRKNRTTSCPTPSIIAPPK